MNALRPPLLMDDDESLAVAAVEEAVEAIPKAHHFRVQNYISVVHLYDDNDFIMHFRLSRKKVRKLIRQFGRSHIYINITGHGGGSPTTPQLEILAFLWFVGHQSACYRDVADRFNIALNTLFNIITRVCDFIFEYLAPSVIRFPTEEEKNTSVARFGFPGAIGAIDGSHVRIDRPKEDPDSYINRKRYYSIQLQGLANENKKFLDVFVGYPGSCHDARVFKESDLYEELNTLCPRGFYILGDSAYPCSKNVMVPYRDNGHLTAAQKRFNKTLSKSRVVIENTFGALKQRFRQLYFLKLRSIERIVKVVHACCVLHNIANEEDLTLFDPPAPILTPEPSLRNRVLPLHEDEVDDDRSGAMVRDEICRQLAS